MAVAPSDELILAAVKRRLKRDQANLTAAIREAAEACGVPIETVFKAWNDEYERERNL